MMMTPNVLITIDRLIEIGQKIYDRPSEEDGASSSASRLYNLAIVHVVAEAAGLHFEDFDKMRSTLENKDADK